MYGTNLLRSTDAQFACRVCLSAPTGFSTTVLYLLIYSSHVLAFARLAVFGLTLNRCHTLQPNLWHPLAQPNFTPQRCERLSTTTVKAEAVLVLVHDTRSTTAAYDQLAWSSFITLVHTNNYPYLHGFQSHCSSPMPARQLFKIRGSLAVNIATT